MHECWALVSHSKAWTVVDVDLSEVFSKVTSWSATGGNVLQSKDVHSILSILYSAKPQQHWCQGASYSKCYNAKIQSTAGIQPCNYCIS